MKSGIMVCVC